MRRALLILAVCALGSASGQVSGNIPDADPPAQVTAPVLPPAQVTPPAVSVDVPPPSTVTVQAGTNDPALPWWANSVLVGALSAGLTGLLAHRLGMRKQSDDVSLQRDNVDLTAIQQRDKAFTDLLDKFVGLSTQLSSQMSQRDDLIAENAVNKTRLEDLLKREGERETRERDLLTKFGALEAAVKHTQDCRGGSPCPLAGMRSQS